jgi:hypothetical protein
MAFMKRAFSAEVFLVHNPGALPQAELSGAPLALNIYTASLQRSYRRNC